VGDGGGFDCVGCLSGPSSFGGAGAGGGGGGGVTGVTLRVGLNPSPLVRVHPNLLTL